MTRALATGLMNRSSELRVLSVIALVSIVTLVIVLRLYVPVSNRACVHCWLPSSPSQQLQT